MNNLAVLDAFVNPALHYFYNQLNKSMEEKETRKMRIALEKLRKRVEEEIKEMEKIHKDIRDIEYDLKRSQ